MYRQSSAEANPEGAAPGTPYGEGSGEATPEGDVIDAEVVDAEPGK
jgi:hypothetical protein